MSVCAGSGLGVGVEVGTGVGVEVGTGVGVDVDSGLGVGVGVGVDSAFGTGVSVGVGVDDDPARVTQTMYPPFSSPFAEVVHIYIVFWPTLRDTLLETAGDVGPRLIS